jgi:hypothetical protein
MQLLGQRLDGGAVVGVDVYLQAHQPLEGSTLAQGGHSLGSRLHWV